MANNESESATSQSRPRYMTATRSDTDFTTARSCAMNNSVRPKRAFMSSSRLTICARIETSSAETGSSQTIRLGSSTSARAMAMRWHWPPENSCGLLFQTRSGSSPTASITARTRRVRSAASDTPDTISGSAMISATLRRGLSEAIGSWKII